MIRMEALRQSVQLRSGLTCGYGPGKQRELRQAERLVRMAAVAFRRRAGQGLCGSKAADLLGLSVHTLAHWERRWRIDRLQARPRGRPAHRSPPARRNAVIATLQEMGPHTGVPALQGLYADMPRREVEDLVRRYKHLYACWKHENLSALEWLVPGAVWTLDHAMPPCPVDAVYPVLWAVRDLASQEQLVWQGVTDTSAATADDWLETLFIQYGPPLVIKSDNGPVGIARRTDVLLHRWGVRKLLSPPRMPAYNGSCEAGIGSLKKRTAWQAALRGHPPGWSSQDCETARLQANRTARPWGPSGPTPHETWEQRSAITSEIRTRFLETVRDYEAQLYDEIDATPDLRVRRRIERQAVTRALIAYGILCIRGRSISPPLKWLFQTRIT